MAEERGPTGAGLAKPSRNDRDSTGHFEVNVDVYDVHDTSEGNPGMKPLFAIASLTPPDWVTVR